MFSTDLWEFAGFSLVLENVEIRRSLLRRMQVGRFNQRSDVLSVSEGLQRLITDVDWMEDGSLPIGVFVNDGGQDLLQVKLVRVADKGAEETIASVYFHAVLIVVRAEGEVRFGLRHSKKEVIATKTMAQLLLAGLVLVFDDDAVDAGSKRMQKFGRLYPTPGANERRHRFLSQTLQLGRCPIARSLGTVHVTNEFHCVLVRLLDQRPRTQSRTAQQNGSLEQTYRIIIKNRELDSRP